MTNMGIKNLDRICLLIVLAVSLGCGYLTVHSVMARKQQFEIEKDILSARMKEVNLAETNLNELKARLDATKNELDLLDERVPAVGKIGVLLQQIDALMRQRKIEMIKLQPMTAREEKIYTRTPIDLEFKGDFVDVCHLLHELERINRIVVMENMTIAGTEAGPCRVNLTASVFER